MSVMRWSTPFEEMDLLRKEMEGLLSVAAQHQQHPNQDFNPPVEVVEGENQYRVRLLLPGLSTDRISEHVHLDATQKTLTISGELLPPGLDNHEKLLVNQFRYGKFFKQLSFPEGIDPEKIEAHYANGFLSVHLPKATAFQKRSIQIQVAG